MSRYGYAASAPYYDLVYRGMGKDYRDEATCLRGFFEWKLQCASRRLLDIGCGTGAHAQHFSELGFQVEGLDISPEMLAVARRRSPAVTFHEGDLSDIKLAGKWGVITSEFGAIAHLLTYEELCQFCTWCWDHLETGGVLAYEPWIRPPQYHLGWSAKRRVCLPELEVTREGFHAREGDVAHLDQFFTIVRPGRVVRFHEQLLMALYTTGQYENAMRAAGFAVDSCYNRPTLRGTIYGKKL